MNQTANIYFGHVARMSTERLPHVALYGSRHRGRRRKSGWTMWRKVVRLWTWIWL